jgi:hypothetical protein
MNLRAIYALIVPLLLVAALLPQPAAADNSATSSIGTVQAGGIAAAPAAAGELLNGAVQTAATAPVAVGSNGGDNSASRSIGTVQVGGDNSADTSLLTVQASDLRTRPAAAVRAAGLRARVALPIATGSGRNEARRSAVTVQLGGGRSDSSTGRIQADRPSAGVPAAVTRDRGGSPERGIAVGDSRLAADVDVDLGSLHARVNRVGLEPRLGLDLRPLDGAALGGQIGVEPPAGSAERSFGTVQAGGVTVAPTLVLWTPLGTLGLGGRTLGIAGGGNQATDSIGTAQVGGGNDASGSLGSVQVGGISVGPRLTLADSPVGDAVVEAPVAIGGPGGNRAADSIGTVQVGGGNTVRNSILTLQVGSSSTATSPPPTCCTDGGPGPTGGGTPGGGTPVGTVASGNGSSTGGAGTPSSGTGTGGGAGVPATAGAPGGRSSDGIAPDGEEPNSEGVLPTSTSSSAPRPAGGVAGGELPFTGVPLWLLAYVGLFLVAGGLAVRRAGK